MRNYHGNHLSRGTHTPPPKSEPYVKHLFLGKCGAFKNKLKQVKVESVCEEVSKQEAGKGTGGGQRFAGLGNKDSSPIALCSVCTQTREHTLHVYLTISVTPLPHGS